MKRTLKALQATAALAAILLVSTSNATSISLIPFNASTSGVDVSVDVSVGNGSAQFVFANNSVGAAAGSAVARIYFESGLGAVGLSNGTVTVQSSTDFSTSYGGPGSPPSGNNMPDTPWAGNLIAFGATPPPPSNGIGVGDSLTIVFAYAGTETALLEALTAFGSNARIAAHILDCNNGNSCVASVHAVPVPAALPLFLAALGALGFVRRRV